MEVIYDNRRTGKTTTLINMAAAENLIVVCANFQAAQNVKNLSEDLGTPVEVMTWQVFVDRKYYGRKDFNGFVIDELGLCLQNQSNMPIKAVTLSREV